MIQKINSNEQIYYDVTFSRQKVEKKKVNRGNTK